MPSQWGSLEHSGWNSSLSASLSVQPAMAALKPAGPAKAAGTECAFACDAGQCVTHHSRQGAKKEEPRAPTPRAKEQAETEGQGMAAQMPCQVPRRNTCLLRQLAHFPPHTWYASHSRYLPAFASPERLMPSPALSAHSRPIHMQSANQIDAQAFLADIYFDSVEASFSCPPVKHL